MIRFFFYLAACCAFGGVLGWLTVNIQWFRLLMAVIACMAVVWVFSAWLSAEMERTS